MTQNDSVDDFLSNKSDGELNYLLARYCSPSNYILYENTFASRFNMKQKDFERRVYSKLFTSLIDNTLLSSESDIIK